MSNFYFFFFPVQKSSKGGHGVQSYPNFDPSADVVALDKAITVKGKSSKYFTCYISTLSYEILRIALNKVPECEAMARRRGASVFKSLAIHYIMPLGKESHLLIS